MAKKNWREDKVWIRVVNLENKNDDIPVNVNGERFVIKNGASVNVPRAVLDTLKNAVAVKYKVEGKVDGKDTIQPYDDPRIFVTELSEKEIEEEEDSVEAAKKGILDRLTGNI